MGPVEFIGQQPWVTVIMPSMLEKITPPPLSLWETASEEIQKRVQGHG